MADESDSSDSDVGEQIRVALKLAPSVADRSLEVPYDPIAVPSDIGRKGLSAIVNHLLGRGIASDAEEEEDAGENVQNFEFILRGTNNRLLRKGVEKEARQHGLSLEQAIEITYFPASNAPKLDGNQFELPDWISSLSVQKGYVAYGCYNGSMHLYDTNDGLRFLDMSIVSNGPLKCVESTLDSDGKVWFASASMDHTLHIHSTNDTGKKLVSVGQCKREDSTAPVSCLGFSLASSSILASGDSSGILQIWDLSQHEEAPSKKKSKAGNGREIVFQPKATIKFAHTQNVSGISWGNHDASNSSKLITSSWDHSIKLWDVGRQDCLVTLNGGRVVTCLDTSYFSEGVTATGHPDCSVRLWDVRVANSKSSSLVSDNTFRPVHKEWVSDVAWSRTNPYHLASTSYDGTVRVWDIRSSIPLHSLRVFEKEEKGMCVGWHTTPEKESADPIIFAGGTDRMIKQLVF